jgi:hypothetical protein
MSWHDGTVKRSKSKIKRHKRQRGGKTGRQDHAKRGEEKEKGWIIMHSSRLLSLSILQGLNTSPGF